MEREIMFYLVKSVVLLLAFLFIVTSYSRDLGL